ncbi:MAG: S24 family peptidase [Patescibacteria group bacterium]
MIDIRQSLKTLAADKDLRGLSIRAIGRELAVNSKEVHPETVKFHWKKLFEAGDISYLYDGRTHDRRSSSVNDVALPDDAKLVSIPVFGVADCGPATQVADQQDLGTLRISSRLLETSRYDSLYSVQASGISMNNTSVHGRAINDGDYVIVDRSRNSPRNGDCVVAIVDGLANIKKFYREHGRISLVSESSEHYDPIFISPEDQSDSLIGGTVIQVVPKPKHPK